MPHARTAAERAAIQRRVDAVAWYHEFDFGDGVKASPKDPHADVHRNIWKFVEKQLDGVDFRGKSVLDIGCWDGYWSFHAERRGAKSVLATDDWSQNWQHWTGPPGIHVAKELLGSKVEIDLTRSVYDLAGLNRKFDVILFLGVYYHLHAPFQAFAQIRHCCHPGTVVLVDGPVTHGLEPGGAWYSYADHSCEWLPTPDALRQIAEGTYFDVRGSSLLGREEDVNWEVSNFPLGWRNRARLLLAAALGSRKRARATVNKAIGPREAVNRMFLQLTPRTGKCAMHQYAPPFGLAAYDPRFKAKAA
jgi:tRNA (mo5U34)-methyltransferase